MTDAEATGTIAQLKRQFHAMMNGVVSGSMRDKGVTYGVNFGVEAVRLVELSRTLTPDSRLAEELWRQRVRECRLLAPMVYPAGEFEPDMCDAWLDTLATPEEAQYLSMHLLQKLPYAPQKVKEWMASERELVQLCGLLTAGRLIAADTKFYARERNELLDQCETALYSKNSAVAKAALNTLQKFAGQNSYQEAEVERIFSKFAHRKG